jgi:hypothetical protein
MAWAIPALVGVLLVAAGYQLRFKKRYSLIAGYDSRRTRNPEPLARMLGRVLLVGGACLMFVAVGSGLFPAIASWNLAVAVIAVGMLTAVLVGSVVLNRRRA